MWRLIVVCVVPAIFRGLNAFIPHSECKILNRRGTMLWSLKDQPTLTHNRAIYHSTMESSSYRSLYTLFCRVMNQLYYEWALHLSSWRKICRLHIYMGVANLYTNEMNYISMCKSYFWTAEIRSSYPGALCVDPEVGIIRRHRVPIDPILSQVNPVHIPLTYCLFRIHCNFAFLFTFS